MATVLYRIGHFAYRRAWLVIGIWVLHWKPGPAARDRAGGRRGGGIRFHRHRCRHHRRCRLRTSRGHDRARPCDRLGNVISLVLLALQLVSASGLYPIELVATPFQTLSPFLPLTWDVNGLQAILSESGGADVAAAAILLLFAIGSVLLSFWSVA